MLQKRKLINVNLNSCVPGSSYLEEYGKDLMSMIGEKAAEAARWQTEK